MNHLTLDEIIDFVSVTEINEETMQLMGKVNAHVARCRECRELVRSYQLVYDEVIRMAVHGGIGANTVVAEDRIAAICAADAVNNLEN